MSDIVKMFEHSLFNPNDLKELLTILQLTDDQKTEIKQAQSKQYSKFVGKMVSIYPINYLEMLSKLQLTDSQKTELKQLHIKQASIFGDNLNIEAFILNK